MTGGGLEDLKEQGVVDYHCRWLDKLRSLVLAMVEGIDAWTPSFAPTGGLRDPDGEHDVGREEGGLEGWHKGDGRHGEGDGDDAQGFDTHALKKVVDRYIRGCKSLMLEYESGCKECAARAIMQWSLFQLADIGLSLAARTPRISPQQESRLLHDPGSSQKRKIFTAGKKALGEGLTIACLGFGKIAKQNGDRILAKVLAGAAGTRARNVVVNRSEHHKEWLVERSLLKQPSQTAKPPRPLDGTNRSLMSLVLELSGSYQTIDGQQRPAVQEDEQDRQRYAAALATAKGKIITDFFPPGNATVTMTRSGPNQRTDGLTLTACDQEEARDSTPKSKKLHMVADGLRDRIRVSMALRPEKSDADPDHDGRASQSVAEQEQDASFASRMSNAACSDVSGFSGPSRTRQQTRHYFYGHTSSSFHRTSSMMPRCSSEGGGGWAGESHKWEVDDGIVGQGKAHDASVDKWPRDILIPPPSSEEGDLAITRPHVVLDGQTFRVRLDKERLDTVLDQLAISGSDLRPVQLGEILPSWQVLEPVKIASLSSETHSFPPDSSATVVSRSDSANHGDKQAGGADEEHCKQIEDTGHVIQRPSATSADHHGEVWGPNNDARSPGERAILIAHGRLQKKRALHLADTFTSHSVEEERRHSARPTTSFLKPSARRSPLPFAMYGPPSRSRGKSGHEKEARSRQSFERCVEQALDSLSASRPGIENRPAWVTVKRSAQRSRRIDDPYPNLQVERRLRQADEQCQQIRKTYRGLSRTGPLVQTFALLRDLES